jgi:hypothetical protein
MRYKLIFVGSLLLVLFTVFLLRDLRAYRQAGTQPSNVNVAQVREIAATESFTTRWVRLTEPLELMCSQSLRWQQEDNISIIVLAYDQSKQQPFWLAYKGQHSCDELKSLPLEGMLVQPDKFWIKQGMTNPSTAYPLIELKVGDTPADLRRDINNWIWVDVLGITMLAFAYILKPRQRTLSRPQAVRLENPWSAPNPRNR